MTDEQTPSANTLDIIEIMSILPHRYPLLLIDRVIEMERKNRIVAIKNVTINEPHFHGHFPGFPIMPGVLIVEAIAQAGGALLLTEFSQHDRDTKLMVFTGIDNARFRRPSFPATSSASKSPSSTGVPPLSNSTAPPRSTASSPAKPPSCARSPPAPRKNPPRPSSP